MEKIFKKLRRSWKLQERDKSIDVGTANKKALYQNILSKYIFGIIESTNTFLNRESYYNSFKKISELKAFSIKISL